MGGDSALHLRELGFCTEPVHWDKFVVVIVKKDLPDCLHCLLVLVELAVALDRVEGVRHPGDPVGACEIDRGY